MQAHAATSGPRAKAMLVIICQVLFSVTFQGIVATACKEIVDVVCFLTLAVKKLA